MSIWMTPLPVRDAYDALTRKLSYPSSETLRKILETAMRLEEAQLMVEMPGTVDALAAHPPTLPPIPSVLRPPATR
jgi:hypothetical protein